MMTFLRPVSRASASKTSVNAAFPDDTASTVLRSNTRAKSGSSTSLSIPVLSNGACNSFE